MRATRWPLVAAIILALAASAPAGAQQARPLYKDPRQPVERRVEDLLARMTLEEKVAQLLTVWEQKAEGADVRRPFLAPPWRRRPFPTASAASPAHPTSAE